MMILPPGDVEVLQQVGSGGFGLVYRGWSKLLRKEIALKMIQGSHGSNLEKLVKDLKKERDVMQKASDTYVLRLIGVYEKPEGNLTEYGLVMEYMPYGSLRSLFDKIFDVPWALRFQILDQVALGMNYLHSLDPPIIHRDLKPCNVLLNKNLDIQITDFGLSKIVGATSSAAPSFAGTLSYIAPESLNDINYHPVKSYDVYSYGILTWTMFSREEPYPGIHPAVIQRCVSEGQRPKESVLDQYRDVKMVLEAKELMIRCWNQNAEHRPSFHDCSGSTALMFDAYKEEIVDVVRSVQDLLREMPYQDQFSETSGTLESCSTDMRNFIEVLGRAGQTKQEIKESCSVDEETEDEETEDEDHENDNMAIALPSKVKHDKEDISTAEVLMNNIDTAIKGSSDYQKIMNNIETAIKGSGDYQKIMNKLDNEGILTKDEVEKLDGCSSLKDFGNQAGKVMITKYIENPKTVYSFLKKLF
ncbi:receptor-interacting serine/threonine-protein kinase 3-like [Rhinoderma darwinii]|uniref:receptor-interacting serine/threonine-protein kinase 3-like n=1 Tax=Rhinoderma darwinii TaxID=43563 RepID=UPI003F67D497